MKLDWSNTKSSPITKEGFRKFVEQSKIDMVKIEPHYEILTQAEYERLIKLLEE